MSQSVLNISAQHQTLEPNATNDNEDGKDYTVCPKTPEHLKQYNHSTEISPSVFDVKRRRRCVDNTRSKESSTELSREDIIESDDGKYYTYTA